jgi:hypothetical protein
MSLRASRHGSLMRDQLVLQPFAVEAVDDFGHGHRSSFRLVSSVAQGRIKGIGAITDLREIRTPPQRDCGFSPMRAGRVGMTLKGDIPIGRRLSR